MSYLAADMGPGAIGNMAPTHGLASRPTIGSNDLRRNIRAIAPKPRNIPSMHGCSGCMGSNGNGNGTSTTTGNGNGGLGNVLKALILPAAIGAALYVAFKG